LLARQLCLLAVLALGLCMPTAVYANHIPQQRPSQCYYCIIAVTLVNVVIPSSSSLVHQFAFAINPSQIATGTPFIIQFRAVYPTGTSVFGQPVTLAPNVASFSFTNSTGASYFLTNVPVNPVPNQLGNYTYASTIPRGAVTGIVTVAVLARSLTDGEGATGPPATTASHNSLPPLAQTPSMYDNSIFAIGTAQVTSQPSIPITVNLTTQSVLSVMLIFILGALILMVKGRRWSKARRVRTD